MEVFGFNPQRAIRGSYILYGTSFTAYLVSQGKTAINLTDKIFHDDEAARLHLEAQRWPDGAYCPHCGECEKVTELQGKSTKPGTYICKSCRTKFTVTVGTVFERSHVGLAKWLLAFRLMAASKKGVSAHQLHRSLDVTYKTAWFMAHRIRAAMAETNPGPLGGEGKTVEVDETYMGGKEKNKHKNKRVAKWDYLGGKQAVVTLVERDGKARSFHVANVTSKTLRPIVVKHASRKSNLMTDGAAMYPDGRRVRLAWLRRSRSRRVRPWPDPLQHGREFLLDPEARRLRHLSPRERGPSGPLPRRVRLPLQQPPGQRRHPYRRDAQGHHGQAPDLSAVW